MILRRPFTVIEVIIALSLASLIMTTLTYFYMQIQQINTKTEKSLEQAYQIAYLQSRLSGVIPKAVAENNAKNDFLFFTSTDAGADVMKQGMPSLVFTYDNGTDMNKSLSNNVVGRLFLDNERRLVLATWPSFKRWKEGSLPPIKKEILLDNVDSLSFSFYIAPNVERIKVVGSQERTQKKKMANAEPPNSWTKEWKFEYYELPAIVKISIVRDGKTIPFTFPLPNSNKVPYYYR